MSVEKTDLDAVNFNLGLLAATKEDVKKMSDKNTKKLIEKLMEMYEDLAEAYKILHKEKENQDA